MGRCRSKHAEHVRWRFKKKSDEEYESYRFWALGRYADDLDGVKKVEVDLKGKSGKVTYKASLIEMPIIENWNSG